MQDLLKPVLLSFNSLFIGNYLFYVCELHHTGIDMSLNLNMTPLPWEETGIDPTHLLSLIQ